MSLRGTTDQGEVWTFGLRLDAWGRGEALAPTGNGTVETAGGRIEIRREGLTEWYANDSRGIEQGFTIELRPCATEADEGLRLMLVSGGAFTPHLHSEGQAVRLVPEKAGPILHYSGLRAWDSGSKPLAARFALEDDRIVLLVDDRDALYPITIDPWLWSEEDQLVPSDAANGDSFGEAVCVSGDTALVGAPRNEGEDGRDGTVYVFVRSGTQWVEQAQLVSGIEDHFARRLALDGDTAVVGVNSGDSATVPDCGAVYVYVRNGTSWSEQAKLTASDAVTGDGLGGAVAIDGDTIIAGASNKGTAGTSAGYAYVFVRSGTVWSEQASFAGSTTVSYDDFGCAVDVSGDTAVVGASWDDDLGSGSGAAFVFVRSGGTWSEQARLLAGDGSDWHRFGWSVALDGDTALVGAFHATVNLEPSAGAGYVFTRNGTIWSQQAKLVASNADGYDYLGYSASLSGDSAVLGAYAADPFGNDSGAAYVFARTGTIWTEQAQLLAPGGAMGDEMGSAVAISGDVAIIGAPGEDDGGAGAGTAHVFQRVGDTWSTTDRLLASDTSLGDQSGWSVALDGDRAVVGARFDSNSLDEAGAAFVFAKVGHQWEEEAKLVADDAAAGDRFGWSVGISASTVLVGAPFDDDGGEDSGSAYVFVHDGTTWLQQAKLTAYDAASGDGLGLAVGLDGDTALVGAPLEDRAGYLTGAAYVFARDGSSWSETARLTASDFGADEAFGASVAVHGDAALIGSPAGMFLADSGSAYVFEGSGTSWSETARIEAADASVRDRFGTSVSLSAGRGFVGAPGVEAAYVFVDAGTSWIQEAKLTASDAAFEDAFGSSVSGHGSTLVVGAPGGDDLGEDAGAAYCFITSANGWEEQAKLTVPVGEAGDALGCAVALSGDRVLLGAWGFDYYGLEAGNAWLFAREAVASTAARHAGSNPASYLALTPPVLGDWYVGRINLVGTTGHSSAWLAGYLAPATLPLPNGPVLLVDPGHPSGEVLGLPSFSGPFVTYNVPIPDDPAFAGLEVFTQALHFGGLAAFALSNAQDLFLGG